MKISIALIIGLFVTNAHAANSKNSKCDILMAIASPANHKECLVEAGNQIRNLDDKKVYFEKLKSWHPPEDLNISTFGYLTAVSVKRKVLAEFAWISQKPAILSWNGKILVESVPHSSISKSIDDLMGQLKNTKSASGFWLPSAIAAEPQDIGKEALFLIANGRPQPTLFTANALVDKETLHPKVDCASPGPKKFDFELPSYVPFAGAASWEATSDPNKFIVRTQASKAAILLEFPESAKDANNPIRLDYYCEDERIHSTVCTRAYADVAANNPKIAPFFSPTNPSCEDLTSGVDWKDVCYQKLREYFIQHGDAAPFSFIPTLSQCDDPPKCLSKTPLSSPASIATALFPDKEGSKSVAGDQRAQADISTGFSKLLQETSVARLISACQNGPCGQDLADAGFTVCGVSKKHDVPSDSVEKALPEVKHYPGD
jgi:hypothetical protein